MDLLQERGRSDVNLSKPLSFCSVSVYLFQVLREAKEQVELQMAERESSHSEKKVAAHYNMLFDEFQGLSHLEALEILSQDSKCKVQVTLYNTSSTVIE